MQMPRANILRVAGYTVFVFIAMLFSFYLTFPADALAARVAHEVQKATHGVWTVTFGEVGMYRFSGLSADDVVLRKAAPGDAPLEIRLTSISARLRLLPLLMFRQSIDARVVLGAGLIDLRLTPGKGKDPTEFAVEADAVDLGSPPMLSKLLDFPLGGILSGSIDGSWDAEPKKSTGKANVTVANLAGGPAVVQGFSIPGVDLGRIELSLDLKDGKVKVGSFKQTGGNLSLKMSGDVLIKQPPAMSNLELCGAVRADPGFLSANPKMRTALQLAEMQMRKDGEGFLVIPLAGTVSAPQLRAGGQCKL